MNIYITKIKAFTLVETLIAISIMMIAVVGPMTIANKALIAAQGARNTMIATYLAQDGMESIKNIKDSRVNNNTKAEYQKLDFLEKDNCGKGNNKKCYVPSPVSGLEGPIYIGEPCPALGCRMYINDNPTVAYTYDDAAPRPSTFYRYYNVDNYDDSEDHEYVYVNVYVDWKDQGVENEIFIRELMTNKIH